ncbi:MAG: cell division protein FtsA [Candidatus Spechtbacterales bacterium]|nr:cell division protein FtsA [Candidatus Spechtbacterales bacterium]
MPRENIVTGIDIGSHYITTVVGAINPDLQVPQVIGIGRVRSGGIRKGVIIDAEEAGKRIGRSINEAERSAGVSIQGAYVSVGGDHVVSMPSRGVVAVSRADGHISGEDVERVITAASTVALPKNREILHNIAKEFIIDGEGGLRDVVGMNGLRLEANTIIIGGSSSHIKNMEQGVVDNDVDVDGLILGPIAASKAVLSKRQKELGVLCLDIGGGTTSMAVFEEGKLIYTNVLPLGGDNITNDLAIGLRVDVDVAERVKREYGMALESEVQRRDTIDLSQFDPNEKESVSRKDVVEIMQARLNEIFDVVNDELKEIGKEAFLPGGVVLVGGTAKVPHIVDLCREKLRLPVQIGFPRDVEGVTASVDDPSYATAMGLVFWGLDQEGGSDRSFAIPSVSMGNQFESVKKWLKNLLP